MMGVARRPAKGPGQKERNMLEGKRLNNQGVVRFWRKGLPAKNGSGGDYTFHTDGESLWSYKLLIGVTEGGRKVLFRYRAPRNFISLTTSRHVGQAEGYADDIREVPDAI